MSIYSLYKEYVNNLIMNGESLNSLFVSHMYTRHYTPTREAPEKNWVSQTLFSLMKSSSLCKIWTFVI